MIQSNLIVHPVDGVQLLFFDTASDGKHIFTACGIGNVKKNDAHLSDIARSTLQTLGDYVQNTVGKVSAIIFQEIATIQIAPIRVQKAIAKANDKDIVFFVCRSPDIYDAAVRVLNVRWKQHDTLQ